MALAGKLTFNPLTDTILSPSGQEVKLDPPTADEYPRNGFDAGESGYLAPDKDSGALEIKVAKNSERLQILEPFPAWEGEDIKGLLVLLKAKGKCTTDHISPAGKWLKFRGHLERISDNMFTGADNIFGDKAGTGINVLSGEKGLELTAIAKQYKAAGHGWVAVGDENYGEGSSREHAAMSPRYLGARAVIVRSFARIHETNLKKQGVLPLIFTDPMDYEKVLFDDRVSILGLQELAVGQPLTVHLVHSDQSEDWFEVNQSFSQPQIEWFRAGSALNLIAAQNQ